MTEYGIQVMKENNPIMYKYSFDQKTNKVKDQLWDIMNTFGKFIDMGNKTVFKNSVILLKDQDLF